MFDINSVEIPAQIIGWIQGLNNYYEFCEINNIKVDNLFDIQFHKFTYEGCYRPITLFIGINLGIAPENGRIHYAFNNLNEVQFDVYHNNINVTEESRFSFQELVTYIYEKSRVK